MAPAIYKPKKNGTEAICCLESENRSVSCLEMVVYFKKGKKDPAFHNVKMMSLQYLKRTDLLYILEKCKYDDVAGFSRY